MEHKRDARGTAHFRGESDPEENGPAYPRICDAGVATMGPRSRAIPPARRARGSSRHARPAVRAAEPEGRAGRFLRIPPAYRSSSEHRRGSADGRPGPEPVRRADALRLEEPATADTRPRQASLPWSRDPP